MTASAVSHTDGETGLGICPEVDGSGLSLEVHHQPGAWILEVRGELDIATVHRLCAALAVARGGPTGRVVLDLSGVTFLDSYGAASIEVARRALADCGIATTLRSPSHQVTRVLQLAGYCIDVTEDPS